MTNFHSEDPHTDSLLSDFKLEDNSSRKPRKPFELSNCRIWVSILLSLISPLCGYIHTRRFSSFLKFLGVSFTSLLILQGISQTPIDESEEMQGLASLGMSIAAVVDNTSAIKKARKAKTEQQAT